MNRVDFMKQLESLLQNISPAEREEALQYYNEYFNDAGEENEQDVIEALGNPAKVAENIKRDLSGNGYGDNTYHKVIAEDKALVEYHQSGKAEDTKSNQLSTGMIVLIVILCVLASPIALGAGSGILGALVGIVTTWFSLILAFGVVAVACFFCMLVLGCVGIMCVIQSPLVGILVFGMALFLGGIGILFMMLTVAMAGIATPAICKGIANLFQKLFGKKETA